MLHGLVEAVEDALLVALAVELPHHADLMPLRSPVAPWRAASTTAGTGASMDVESIGSWPAITSCSSAASSTVRAHGPPWSSEEEKATRP